MYSISKDWIWYYYAITQIITTRFNAYETRLLSKFKNLLDYEGMNLLDNLIKAPKKIDDKISRYKLTLLKKINHSTKPGKIKESIDDFIVIQTLYQQINPIINELILPVKAIKYYAMWTTKADATKLLQFSNPYKRYLHLISFIAHQYYFRQDLFVDSLLSSVQSIKNAVRKLEKEQYFDSKNERAQAIVEISKLSKSLKAVIAELTAIIESESLSSNEKIIKAKELLELNKLAGSASDNSTPRLEVETFFKAHGQNYYELLETKSVKLQNRVNLIIKCLEFNDDISDDNIVSAINYYKLKDGNIDKNAPIAFLENDEQVALYDDCGKFRISLYKALLFIHIASAIKSGRISLKHSYRYLSIDEYLIDKKTWQNQREELVKKAGLELFADLNSTIKMLKKDLNQQYQATNDNILNEKNQHIKFNQDEKPISITPKLEKEDNRSASELFLDDNPHPILQILSDINQTTNFVSCFEHYNVKHAKQKPSDEVFFGGIMGYGFDLGTNRIAKISKGINPNTLNNTINWYFTLDNLYAANNVLNEQINRLNLPDVFLRNQDQLHTASDGQKFDIAVDSLGANYSFKYFGKEKGISVYSFTDEKHRLFYSTAFSSSEREAAYVIDGLLHNDEIGSSIHSTDTHGFSEIIFATTHMLGIFFAPRIKNLKKQKLYSFKDQKIKDFKDKSYKILPSEYIDEDLIRENWDDILRLIVTIKLKHSSASQIFKRLSSYAKQNPIYQALKEFGRITKTLFILRYYDDLELRQAIEKQLNLVELSHEFAKAIFFGNNQEFQAEGKEEQEIIVNCRRLIQNAIVLWNYLYLTKLLMETKEKDKQQEMLKIIQNGSIMTWQHVNLHGEYDFTKVGLGREEFDMKRIMEFEL